MTRAWLNTSKNTHLDRPQLSLCVSLVENGVNPEALAVGHAWHRGARNLTDGYCAERDQGAETRCR